MNRRKLWRTTTALTTMSAALTGQSPDKKTGNE